MINLENLLDGTITDRNFQKLAQLVVDTGGQSVGIRFGAQTLTWTAAANTPLATITHGLGRTPVVAVGTVGFGSGGQSNLWATVGSIGATTFGASGNAPGAITATAPFYWVAIG